MGGESVDAVNSLLRCVGEGLLIVGCGAGKIWSREPTLRRVPAADAYTGAPFRSARRFATRFFPGAWRILSARHGLIRPGQLIGNYDERLPRPIDARRRDLLKGQLSAIEVPGSLIVLAGATYVEWVRLAAESHDVRSPMDGLPLFARMRALAHASRIE